MKNNNTVEQIENIFMSGSFSIENWINYIERLFPNSSSIFLEDIKDYDFKSKCLPILNNVIVNRDKITKISLIFDHITLNLESTVNKYFNRPIDVEIVLYLGLCNGAGWVTDINGQTKVLLGIEKILELNWDDEIQMKGLIYHELGHVYQKQYGVLDRVFNHLQDKYLWQLFTEGVAMHFEQMLVGDFSYYHQDDGDWKQYYDSHLVELKKDFNKDIEIMNDQNQRYFGDWVLYNSYSDAGYYLGAKLIQYIRKYIDFNEIISFSINEVKYFFQSFLKN
ncbi:MAG: hypothetical protein WCS48_02530 [Candidatus Izemoplasmatales bacterium]